MSANRSGFTIVELLVSVTVLTVGLLAMGAGIGRVTTTLSGSRIATESVQLATRRMDRLRAAARSTAVPCTSGLFTSSSGLEYENNIAQSWVVPGSGSLRRVLVINSYSVGRGRTRVDTLATTISCA
jgi:prepilin-type N-terminal cleavage/methylation domain-containing protein